jgi:hypothetical protein
MLSEALAASSESYATATNPRVATADAQVPQAIQNQRRERVATARQLATAPPASAATKLNSAWQI